MATTRNRCAGSEARHGVRRLRSSAAAGAAALALSLPLGGCVGELVGMMAYNAQREGSKVVPAEYTGLTGKSFAVVINADRVIQADQPLAIERLTVRISDEIRAHAGASGWVPGRRVLEYQYNNPRWAVMPPGELAKELGVDRLVYIDLDELRLHEPGNAWTWDGVASGTLGVIEADSTDPESFQFEKSITVRFPDDKNAGPMQMDEALVRSALLERFVDRASWVFYEHEEANIIPY